MPQGNRPERRFLKVPLDRLLDQWRDLKPQLVGLWVVLAGYLFARAIAPGGDRGSREGVLVGARKMSSRDLYRIAASANQRQLEGLVNVGLAGWRGDDLRLVDFPTTAVERYERQRAAAAKGGRAKAARSAESSGTSSALGSATSSTHGTGRSSTHGTGRSSAHGSSTGNGSTASVARAPGTADRDPDPDRDRDPPPLPSSPGRMGAPAGVLGEKHNGPEGFERWWSIYPKARPSWRAKALQVWVREDLEGEADEVIAWTEHKKRSAIWLKVVDGEPWFYVPTPAKLLADGQWRRSGPWNGSGASARPIRSGGPAAKDGARLPAPPEAVKATVAHRNLMALLADVDASEDKKERARQKWIAENPGVLAPWLREPQPNGVPS
jgi:hypothetical protein